MIAYLLRHNCDGDCYHDWLRVRRVTTDDSRERDNSGLCYLISICYFSMYDVN